MHRSEYRTTAVHCAYCVDLFAMIQNIHIQFNCKLTSIWCIYKTIYTIIFAVANARRKKRNSLSNSTPSESEKESVYGLLMMHAPFIWIWGSRFTRDTFVCNTNGANQHQQQQQGAMCVCAVQCIGSNV